MYVHVRASVYVCMIIMSTVLIIGSTTLKVLNIGYNNFGDNGILMISEDLQINNLLIRLSADKCGLSVKGKELTVKAYSLQYS